MYPSHHRLPPFLDLIFVESARSFRHHRPSAASLATLKNRYARSRAAPYGCWGERTCPVSSTASLSRNYITTKGGNSQTSTRVYNTSMRNNDKKVEKCDKDEYIVYEQGGSPFVPSFSPPHSSLKHSYTKMFHIYIFLHPLTQRYFTSIYSCIFFPFHRQCTPTRCLLSVSLSKVLYVVHRSNMEYSLVSILLRFGDARIKLFVHVLYASSVA